MIYLFLCVRKVLIAICIQLHCSCIPTGKTSFHPPAVKIFVLWETDLTKSYFSMGLSFEGSGCGEKCLYGSPPFLSPSLFPSLSLSRSFSLSLYWTFLVVASILATFKFCSQQLTSRYAQAVGCCLLQWLRHWILSSDFKCFYGREQFNRILRDVRQKPPCLLQLYFHQIFSLIHPFLMLP